MKKIFKSVVCIALCVIFVFGLSSCGSEDKEETYTSTDKVIGGITIPTFPSIATIPTFDFELETEKQTVTVYVSKSGKKIHSIPNCSGMKNYWEMSYDDAVKAGYSFCKNCY